ncbi:Peptidase S28 family-containing protein [Strongyloides ratti]|uniref:Peptidase S28 family-containing protein n=1 Tax=Strongyloides ratti TaxID=34506 RepID=A0A090LNS2_STRRB|nr:Peptidase S28 family-containing protein [Strongyloides ratti]CEF71411.1 Peptidase S28 family-containing protein [Strongyloides ratti]
MNIFFCFLLILILLIKIDWVNCKLPKKVPASLRFLNGRPYEGFRGHRLKIPEKIKKVLDSQYNENDMELYYKQKLDHFSDDSRQWNQRYFYNGNFYKNNGPQFLNLGGEGPISLFDVFYEDTPFVSWGSQLGAMLFSLEHRFYGKSRPFSSQTVPALTYLTSKQALADAADFIRAMNNKFNIKNPKWVIFGGSYSGALALWFRQQYPDLCVGSVGSSAPVQPVVDFYKYLDVCQNSLYNNGSYTCGEEIKKGIKKLVEYSYDDNKRPYLSLLFQLQPPLETTSLDYKTLQTLYSTIVGNFMNAVQYSRVNAGPFISGSSIPDLCNIMEDMSKDPLDKLAIVNKYVFENMNQQPYTGLDYSYTEEVNFLKDVNFYDNDLSASASRSWIWQTCNEFGYYQAGSAGNHSIWGTSIPNNINIDLCTDVFGSEYNINYIKNAVSNTFSFYGGATGYNVTNVVMPNGDVDPWHSLGVYNQTNQMTPYLIHNTAHCADMEPPSPNDAPGLTYVRKLIFQNIKNWIGVASTSINSNNNIEQNNNIINNEKISSDNLEISKVIELPIQFKNEFMKSYNKEDIMKKNIGMVHGIKNPKPTKDDVITSASDITIGYIEQKLDHFNSTDLRTIQQKYFVNRKFNQNKSIAFVMIGGEGKAGDKWVTLESLPMIELAKFIGADIYQLEHRYYGDSHAPNDDLSTDNYQYLTSKQALADLAVFIKTMNNQYNYVNPQWITFGGSYSGALSAWFRELYPDLTVGAMASSGPVLAKTDFFEYLQVVEKSISTYSQSCANNIAAGFNKMQNMIMTQTGRDSLNKLFTFTYPWNNGSTVEDYDVQSFFSNVYGSFQGAVQYSLDNTGEYSNGYGIKDVCQIMNNQTNEPLINIVNVVNYMNTLYSNSPTPQPMSNTYKETVDFYKSANYHNGGSDAKSWLWQTCNEFGYFQSSDLGYNIFESSCNVNIFINICIDVFGPQFTRETIDQNIIRTNNFYGGNTNYYGSNVVMAYGSVDPWHALGSYTYDKSRNLISYLIDGTAHCADLYPPRDSDVPDLKFKRELIRANLISFLKLQ